MSANTKLSININFKKIVCVVVVLYYVIYILQSILLYRLLIRPSLRKFWKAISVFSFFNKYLFLFAFISSISKISKIFLLELINIQRYSHQFAFHIWSAYLQPHKWQHRSALNRPSPFPFCLVSCVIICYDFRFIRHIGWPSLTSISGSLHDMKVGF